MDNITAPLAPNQDLAAGIRSCTLKKLVDPETEDTVWVVRIALTNHDDHPAIAVRGAGFTLADALLQCAMNLSVNPEET